MTQIKSNSATPEPEKNATVTPKSLKRKAEKSEKVKRTSFLISLDLSLKHLTSLEFSTLLSSLFRCSLSLVWVLCRILWMCRIRNVSVAAVGVSNPNDSPTSRKRSNQLLYLLLHYSGLVRWDPRSL